jgi:hypothetical protein
VRPDWALRPRDGAAEALHRGWLAEGEPLTTLVPVSLPGLKTRFDELLVDDERERLLQRVEEFIAASGRRQLMAFARRWAMPERVWPKLAALHRAARGLTVKPDHVRRFFRYRGPAPMGPTAFCYLERRLIPRGDHRLQGPWDPHQGDARLVFNVREVPLSAHLLEGEGCVTAYRHSRFAPLWVPQAVLDAGPRAGRAGSTGPLVPNLSARGAALAKGRGGALRAFERIAAFVRSDAVQQIWAPAFGTTRVLPVPFAAIAKGPGG